MDARPRRATAMGIFGIGSLLGPALGPSLGGLLIEYLNWRYVFFILVPISLVALPLCISFLPNREKDSFKVSIDAIGIWLLSICLVAFISAFSYSQLKGWDSPFVVISSVVSVISLFLFISWESFTEHPLLDLELFVNRQFAISGFLSFVVGAGLYGSAYLLPLFLQTLQGIRAVDAGNLLIVPGLIMAVMLPIAGRIGDAIEPKPVIIAGLILFAWHSLLFGSVDVNTSFLAIMIWLLLGRIGLGCIFPCLNAAAVASLPFNKLSHVSATVNFLRQLGGAVGVNLVSVYFAHQQAIYRIHLEIDQTANANTLEVLREIRLLLPQLSSPEQNFASLFHLTEMIQSLASTMAFRDSFIVLAILFAVSIIPSWRIHPL